jgi:hypothetical protein
MIPTFYLRAPPSQATNRPGARSALAMAEKRQTQAEQ